MIKPIIGIRLSNKKFVSLLNKDSSFAKTITVSMDSKNHPDISVYLCRMKSEKEIQKIYKLGSICVNEKYFNSEKKSDIQIASFLDDSGVMNIKVYVMLDGVRELASEYEFNIAEIIENRVTQEKDEMMLGYGSFVAKENISAFLMPEKNIVSLSDNELPQKTENLNELLSDENSGGKKNAASAPKNKDGENINSSDDDYYDLANSAKGTHFSIGSKLILIIFLIVLSALGAITFLVSYYVSRDVLVNAEVNNLSTNAQVSNDAEVKLNTISKNVLMLYDLLFSSENEIDNFYSRAKTISSFFENNENVMAIIISPEKKILNTAYFLEKGIDFSKIDIIANSSKQKQMKGFVGVENVSATFGIPSAVMYFLIPNTNQSLCVLFSTDSFAESFGVNSINSSFMVDYEGRVLAASDSSLVLGSVSLLQNPVVQEFCLSGKTNSQIRFDYNGVNYYGAYRRLSFAGVGVITVVETQILLEAVNSTTLRNIFLTIAVLALSILVIWFFAKSITNPIRALAMAAIKIGNGDYSVKLKPRSKDELGLLTKSFTSMSEGLKERERLKDTFGRFTNKAVAERAMRGELELGGENKIATIFFSDIRSFTAMSENLEPSEVVDFLNDYMTRMVKCITKTGGVVDKFIGDAIMAIWGVPLSTGTPKDDALNAVRTALMMRSALLEYNKERALDKKPAIRIGCGINTGALIAGQIGSDERMEYTCIGDSVNVASRTESLNKPLGTDILITEGTYNLVKDFVTVETMPSVMVKGKSKPVAMYAVINMPDEENIPGVGMYGFKTIKDIRTALGIPEPDLNGVDLDAEEKKYKIQTK